MSENYWPITRAPPCTSTCSRCWTADRRETGCPQGSNGAKRSGNIAESLEGDITIEPDWLSEHVGVLPEDRVRIDPEVWTQLARCVERREAIRATYQTFDGRVSGYELHPYHLLAYHGNWYLLAWNVAKARVATFALSRFRQIASAGQAFTRPAEFSPEAYARQAFGIVGGEEPIKVRLLFEPTLAVYITERQWHPSQEFRTRQDGRVEMWLETRGRKELVRWVLSWMPNVKVLAPRSLRDRIAEKLRDGLQRQKQWITMSTMNRNDCVQANASTLTSEESPFEFLTREQLGEYIRLTEDEEAAIEGMKHVFPLKITRHYAELIKGSAPDDPLRRMVIPSSEELKVYDDDARLDIHSDEARYQPVEGIVHRYPGKLLLFPTVDCLSYCRFCYRSGQRVKALLSEEKLQAAFAYIRENEIRDVVVTGGEPLMMPLDRIDYILSSLRAIESVEIIRIGTRALAYAPQVITERLVKILARHKPIFVKNSFVHPREIVSITEEKLAMLADAGIVLLQQGPLLKGVNDSSAVLKELNEKLARNRVLPYYLGFGLVSPGTRHFTVHKEEAISIIDELENKTSGFCIPTLITQDSSNNKTRKRY